MKATITETKTYSITIGDKTFDGFTVQSEWEGLTALRDDKGRRLIVDGLKDDGPSAFLHTLFDNGDKERNVVIIKGSPDLFVGAAKPSTTEYKHGRHDD